MPRGPFFTLRYRAQKERVQKYTQPSNSHRFKLQKRNFWCHCCRKNSRHRTSCYDGYLHGSLKFSKQIPPVNKLVATLSELNRCNRITFKHCFAKTISSVSREINASRSALFRSMLDCSTHFSTQNSKIITL